MSQMIFFVLAGMKFSTLLERGDGLEDIVGFLGSTPCTWLLNLSISSKAIREIITTDKACGDVWYRLIQRTAHQRWIPNHSCYQHLSNEQHNLCRHNIDIYRAMHGECLIPGHRTYAVDSRADNMNTRDIYREWQAVAYRRFKSQYWNSRKENQLKILKEKIKILVEEKEKAKLLEEKYAEIDKQERKRLAKRRCKTR